MNRGTGYRPVPAGVRQDPWHLHRKSYASEPISDAVDMTPYRPPIFDQGQTGSCVGHGTVGAVMTTLAKAGTPASELLCPLSVYRLARCMDRTLSWYGSPSPPPLMDDGTDPDLAMHAIATWGIATCRELLGVDGPGSDYTARLEAEVNREPMLGELEASDAFKLVGQHAILSGGQQRLDDVARALDSGFAVGLAVYASDNRFQCYVGGVLMQAPAVSRCDHWTYLTGFYTDATGHRIYRGVNSWGPSWGESGEFLACEGVILDSDCLEAMSVRRAE